MPDIPNRNDEDADLAAVLLVLFTAWRQDAIDGIGNPPRADNLSPSFYANHAAEVRRALFDKLTDIHFQAALRMAITTGATERVDDLRSAARQWAEARASQLASELADRVRQQVEDAIARYDASVVAAAENHPENRDKFTAARAAAALLLLNSIGSIFGEHRSDGVAITEITGAASAGEYSEARRIGDSYHVRVEAIWSTEEGACPVCEPLDGEDEEVWGDEFPEGPPAHPNCRCSLFWYVDGDLILN